MEHAVLQDIVESVSATDSVSELSVIQLSDSALSGGVPPPPPSPPGSVTSAGWSWHWG